MSKKYLKHRQSYRIVKNIFSFDYLITVVAFCLLLFLLSRVYKSYAIKRGEEIKTVVIDAGHGGKDPGCHGAHTKEKDVALSIALKLGKYIEERIEGVNVIYTRKTDVFVELYERAAIANRNQADFFISIHCNANTSPQPYGTETYVMGLHKNEANLDVSKRENAVILKEDDYSENYEGFDPNSPESHILFSLYQNAHLQNSILLAAKIEDQFKNRVGRRSRGVHQAGFLVLYKTTMPSVLIETGFLTNRTEESFLSTNQGQDYMASAIFRAFRDYKREIEEKGRNDAAFQLVDATNKILVQTNKDSEKDTEALKEEVAVDEPPVALEENKVKSHTEDAQTNINEIDTTLLLAQKDTEKEVRMDEALIYKGSSIVFKVQIGIYRHPVNMNSDELAPMKDSLSLDHYTEKFVKCLVGNYESIQQAFNVQEKLRANNFQGAFVVAYENQKRISIQEAKKKLAASK